MNTGRALIAAFTDELAGVYLIGFCMLVVGAVLGLPLVVIAGGLMMVAVLFVAVGLMYVE